MYLVWSNQIWEFTQLDRTNTGIVPPFFHMDFVMKWRRGLLHGTGSDVKIPKPKYNSLYPPLLLSQFVFVCLITRVHHTMCIRQQSWMFLWLFILVHDKCIRILAMWKLKSITNVTKCKSMIYLMESIPHRLYKNLKKQFLLSSNCFIFANDWHFHCFRINTNLDW